jgi:hypothetical protein
VPPQRKQPILDGWILASVNQAGGLGNYDDEGHYATLVIRGLADRGTAQEWKRGLYRSALYLTRHGTPVSISEASIIRDLVRRSGWQLTFRVSDKGRAIEHQEATYGTNPANYAYNPANRNDPRRYTGGSG